MCVERARARARRRRRLLFYIGKVLRNATARADRRRTAGRGTDGWGSDSTKESRTGRTRSWGGGAERRIKDEDDGMGKRAKYCLKLGPRTSGHRALLVHVQQRNNIMQLCLLLPLTIFLQQTPSSNGRRKVFWREVCSGLVFRKTFLLFLPLSIPFPTPAPASADTSSLPVFTPKLLPVVNTHTHTYTHDGRTDGHACSAEGEKLTLKLLLMTQIILDRAFNPQNKYFRCSSAPYRDLGLFVSHAVHSTPVDSVRTAMRAAI